MRWRCVVPGGFGRSSRCQVVRVAALMSMVAMCSLRVSASCKNRDNVRGMMVGLKLVGSGMSALIMERRRVSPRLAFCLSGSPLWPCAAYPVLFPLFALQDCVDLPYALISCVLDVLVADTRVKSLFHG